MFAARLVIVALVLAGATSVTAYDRSAWPHWTTSACMSTRTAVLVRDARRSTRLPNGCGLDPDAPFELVDPYSGETITDPALVDADHLVALGEAERSGAAGWTRDEKEHYANDLSDADHLVATHRHWNRQKGDRDPASWIPPRCGRWAGAHRLVVTHAPTCCWYAAAFTRRKFFTDLNFDPQERHALALLLATCERPRQ